MPKQVQPLTQLQVRNAKAKDKPCKLADGGGLYLEVMPTGGKLWRMKFRQLDGKENRLSFGSFPEVSLADARTKRDEARHLLAAGADPACARAEQARQARLTAQNTFEHVARDWHRTMINKWQPQTAQEILRRFESDIFPAFGHLPIGEIQAPDVLDAIRAIERRGALEIANRQSPAAAKSCASPIPPGFAWTSCGAAGGAVLVLRGWHPPRMTRMRNCVRSWTTSPCMSRRFNRRWISTGVYLVFAWPMVPRRLPFFIAVPERAGPAARPSP